MKKKRRQRRATFKPISQRQFALDNTQGPVMNIPQLARWAMRAEQKLTPLIIAKQFPPLEALALITMQTKSLAWGKDEIEVNEEEVGAFAGLILACWKDGLFTPSEGFPYSLAEMLAEWDNELPDLNQFKRPQLPR